MSADRLDLPSSSSDVENFISVDDSLLGKPVGNLQSEPINFTVPIKPKE